jgi:hypothetical protein
MTLTNGTGSFRLDQAECLGEGILIGFGAKNEAFFRKSGDWIGPAGPSR